MRKILVKNFVMRKKVLGLTKNARVYLQLKMYQ